VNFFCPGWPQTIVLPISTFHVARIIGISHHTQLNNFFIYFWWYQNSCIEDKYTEIDCPLKSDNSLRQQILFKFTFNIYSNSQHTMPLN
jgi:hypothetical protein